MSPKEFAERMAEAHSNNDQGLAELVRYYNSLQAQEVVGAFWSHAIDAKGPAEKNLEYAKWVNKHLGRKMIEVFGK